MCLPVAEPAVAALVIELAITDALDIELDPVAAMAEVAEEAVLAPEAAAEEEPEQLAAWGNFTLTLQPLLANHASWSIPEDVVCLAGLRITKLLSNLKGL